MRKVIWTFEAEEQYLKTIEFWIGNNKSTTFSEKLIDEVSYVESLLIENPFIGTPVEKTNNEVRRVLVLTNYSLYYRFIPNAIEIISFWGNKMNSENLKVY